jgi:hypothetical protein
MVNDLVNRPISEQSHSKDHPDDDVRGHLSPADGRASRRRQRALNPGMINGRGEPLCRTRSKLRQVSKRFVERYHVDLHRPNMIVKFFVVTTLTDRQCF